MKDNISSIIDGCQKNYPNEDCSIIQKGYLYAEKAHEGQLRKSGEPYVTHPLAVAQILVELEQDPVTVTSGLLHDVLEESNFTTEDIRLTFGEEVAHLVEGVTKLGKLTYTSQEEAQAENFRKMFLAMAHDIRVIIIKLADRLHNMRTLKHLSPKQQQDIAQETREIYAPLAHRIGMWHLKWEIEDLSFMYLQLEEYQKIKTWIAEKRYDRENYITEMTATLQEKLQQSDIKVTILGRPKHFYSIYQKMLNQNLNFDQLYDILGMRIIVEDLQSCYAALGIVHSLWKPIAGRFKDYIAMPKSNMYQSIHTAVIGPQTKQVEIQIRTHKMHRIAEYGIAAHWKYKNHNVRDKDYEAKLDWIRQLVDLHKESPDPKAFLDGLKIDLFVDEVFVFTPKGAVIALPLGATPIDFAYLIHTEIGHRCLGAKVNNAIVPLNSKLSSGDIVEIITGKIALPKITWLNHVMTNQAKSKIKQWFSKQNKEHNVKFGQEELESTLKENLLVPDEILESKYLELALKKYNFKKIDELFFAIANGEVSAKTIAVFIKDKYNQDNKVESVYTETLVSQFKDSKKVTDLGIEVIGLDDVMLHLAKCCHPLPGDEIIGFVTQGHGVSVHRTNCLNLASPNDKRRLVDVRWESSVVHVYPVEVQVSGFDRIGLLNDILTKISQNKTNIREANVRTARDGASITANLILDIQDVEHLNLILRVIRTVSDVYEASRVKF